MKNPRQRLRELIEVLKLPMLPVEIEENMGKLTDEQVESLVYRYEQVKKYEDEVDRLAREKDPEEYQRILDEHDEEEEKLEEEYLKEKQRLYENVDKQLDEAEENYSKDLTDIEKEAEETTTATIDVINTMTDEASKIISENKSS